ncbi:MAG: hypothetical protein WAT39_06825 [Planctomycetota bacterium]
MANDLATPWLHLHRFGWAAALAIPGGLLGLWLGEVCGLQGEEWLSLPGGGAAGIGVGLLLAHACRARTAVHTVLRFAGAGAVVLGIPATVWLFLLAAEARSTGTFLAGLGETLTAWLCVFAVASGAALWLAGWAGRNATAAATSPN